MKTCMCKTVTDISPKTTQDISITPVLRRKTVVCTDADTSCISSCYVASLLFQNLHVVTSNYANVLLFLLFCVLFYASAPSVMLMLLSPQSTNACSEEKTNSAFYN